MVVDGKVVYAMSDPADAHHARKIWTIGHSTRSAEEFIALLRTSGIRGLADVRTIPQSRRHPHFAREALDARLSDEGIEYRHFPALGGLRKPRADSPNGAWRNDAFRGYADHMQTPEFSRARSTNCWSSARGSVWP